MSSPHSKYNNLNPQLRHTLRDIQRLIAFATIQSPSRPGRILNSQPSLRPSLLTNINILDSIASICVSSPQEKFAVAMRNSECGLELLVSGNGAQTGQEIENYIKDLWKYLSRISENHAFFKTSHKDTPKNVNPQPLTVGQLLRREYRRKLFTARRLLEREYKLKALRHSFPRLQWLYQKSLALVNVIRGIYEEDTSEEVKDEREVGLLQMLEIVKNQLDLVDKNDQDLTDPGLDHLWDRLQVLQRKAEYFLKSARLWHEHKRARYGKVEHHFTLNNSLSNLVNIVYSIKTLLSVAKTDRFSQIFRRQGRFKVSFIEPPSPYYVPDQLPSDAQGWIQVIEGILGKANTIAQKNQAEYEFELVKNRAILDCLLLSTIETPTKFHKPSDARKGRLIYPECAIVQHLLLHPTPRAYPAIGTTNPSCISSRDFRAAAGVLIGQVFYTNKGFYDIYKPEESSLCCFPIISDTELAQLVAEEMYAKIAYRIARTYPGIKITPKTQQAENSHVDFQSAKMQECVSSIYQPNREFHGISNHHSKKF
ncbi:MAG: hypothetical protein M1834_004268 [Cirrosporium novae-zelandiae]|nr:MAG: hypothetical protein M1834_004268 [Cirrosporium novae-zelandiae]